MQVRSRERPHALEKIKRAHASLNRARHKVALNRIVLPSRAPDRDDDGQDTEGQVRGDDFANRLKGLAGGIEIPSVCRVLEGAERAVIKPEKQDRHDQSQGEHRIDMGPCRAKAGEHEEHHVNARRPEHDNGAEDPAQESLQGPSP